MSPAENAMMIEALNYAKRGWYVFPCRERKGAPYIRDGVEIVPTEKQPYVAKGLDDATLDEEQIMAWWNMWPNAMIGVNAGKSGLFVVDIDKKHVNGLATYSEWDINDTAGLHSVTPSGGMHVIFTGEGKSSTNAKTGVDTRGIGGYFIAPPSKIIEGEFKGEYKFFDDWSRVPGIIPSNLMGFLFPDEDSTYYKRTAPQENGEKKQLSRATLMFLANGAEEGERNDTLFKVLADFSGCGYSKKESREATLPVSLRIGLSQSEFEQVLEHAYSKPRTPSIPDSIQEKIMKDGKNVATTITHEEQLVMEEAVIACMLTDETIIPHVEDILSSDDFQSIKNRWIYRAISVVASSGKTVDYLTVSDELAKHTNKISLHDVEKIARGFFLNPDNVVTYAGIIKERASIRKIEAVMDNKSKYLKSGSFSKMVYNLEKDIAEVAVEGGIKTTNILDGQQAVVMVRDITKRISTGEIGQLKTGFHKFDEDVGGFYSNELIIFAGRSGDGKSALALSLLNNIAIEGNKSVAMFSLEMSTHESVCRLICQLTGIPFKNVYQGKLTEAQWKEYEEAVNKISQANIFFDDSSGITVPQMRSKIRRMTSESDLDLIIIDQLEQVYGYEQQPAHIKFDQLAYAIKGMAKDFDIPIVLNHQFNRGITDRKLKNPEPELADLNQAGEKPSNQVWAIVHQKDEYGRIIKSKIKMLKNRNGPKIEFPVLFMGERMFFVNPAHKEDINYNNDYNIQQTGWSDEEPDCFVEE